MTLAILVQGVVRALPPDADESARLWPAFSEYRLLAVSALAYYMSIWTDKIVVYLVMGDNAAALYAAVSALAWFSVIPAFAWIYVQIETVFYRRFRAFYDDLEGGAPLRQLRARADSITAETARILRGAGLVQAAVTRSRCCGAPFLMRLAGLSPVRDAAVPAGGRRRRAAGHHAARDPAALLLRSAPRRVLDVGGAVRRRGRLHPGLLGTGVAAAIGYIVACALTSAVGVVLVRRRLGTLLVDTFQSQPFAGRCEQ